MIKPSQLRRLIHDTLKAILPEMNSPEAVELLMMTSAQESFCGRFLQQQGCGVALGIFQMEPATYDDLFDNYLRYHQELAFKLQMIFGAINKETFSLHLRGNLPYQICLARLQYRRFSESIPQEWQYTLNTDWTYALARYYKKYWNTSLGKAKIAEVLRNYDKYAK